MAQRSNSTNECIRVLAIFTVVFAHVSGQDRFISPIFLTRAINFSGFFSLAFFFIFAGYYCGKKVRKGNPVGRVYASYSSHILKLLLLTSLIYLLIPPEGISAYTHYGFLSPLKIAYWNLLYELKGQGPLWHGVLYIFMTSTKYHLWFLISLIWASAITALLVKLGRESWLLWVGAILYAFSAVSIFLSAASIGFSVPFNPFAGPFFGTFFFAVGYRLSRRRTFSMKPAVALLSAGFIILVVDLLFVRGNLGFTIVAPLYQTTAGVGLALLALARPSLGANTMLAYLGRYVLVIYLIHPALIDFLRPLAKNVFPAHFLDLSFTAVVFLFSVLAAMLLEKALALRPSTGRARTPSIDEPKTYRPEPL